MQLHVEEQPQGDAMAAAGLNLWCRSDGCRALLLLGHGCTGEGADGLLVAYQRRARPWRRSGRVGGGDCWMVAQGEGEGLRL